MLVKARTDFLFHAFAVLFDQERTVRWRTLVLFRWVTVIGQLFTVLFVHAVMGVQLPLMALLVAIGLSIIINGFLLTTLEQHAQVPERLVLLLLIYDVVHLGVLLALTGGMQNPFALFLLLPASLAATGLSLLSCLILCGSVVAVATGLTLWDVPLQELPGHEGPGGLFTMGHWAALVLGTAVVAGYSWRLAEDARRDTEAVNALQRALEREQQLSELDGIAAAVAHELGTPLSTITILARELVENREEIDDVEARLQELLNQAYRCRDILAHLRQGMDPTRRPDTGAIPLSELLQGLIEDRTREGVTATLNVEIEEGLSEPRVPRFGETRHALANLLDNALDHAHSTVAIDLGVCKAGPSLRIVDDGPGFPADITERLGEPFISNRARSRAGHQGLGVFLARTLLARTGARLNFENDPNGAKVSIQWAPR